MKRLLPISALFLCASILSSCSLENKMEGSYSISGFTADSTDNGKYAYLSKYGTIIDSTIIIDGQFNFDGMIDSTEFAKIRIDNHNIYFILEQGSILLDKSLPDSPTGTPLNEIFNNMTSAKNEITHDFCEKSNAIWSKIDIEEDLRAELLQECYSIFRNKLDSFILPIIDKNKDNAIATYILWSESMMHNTPEYIDSLYNNCIGPSLKTNPLIVNIIEQNTKLLRTDIGNEYIDFQVCELNDNICNLSDIKDSNKYTVLLFWASWCRLCKIEMAHVISAYKELPKDKVQFLSVIPWDKKEDIIKVLGKYKQISWETVIDHENQGVTTYGILDIPHVIIISPKGNIVSRWISPDRITKEIYAIIETDNY